MNIILVEEAEVRSGRCLLTDHRARHIVKVLRADCGQRLRLGIIDGYVGSGTIVDIVKKYPFRVEIETVFDTPPPAKPPLDYILALPRPIMLRRILSQAAALGVERLHVVNAARVEKSFWGATIVTPEECRQHLLHGLEQAVDTILPKVIFHRHFKPFVEDTLPALAPSYGSLFIAHPGGGDLLALKVAERTGKILTAVGPEGGWSDFEMECFEALGFRSFSLGARILKVDTAVVNIHGRLMVEVERRGRSTRLPGIRRKRRQEGR